MIAIVDYGMGNLKSVQKAFEHIGHKAIVTRDKKIIGDAEKIVLPGVGAFPDCMKNLSDLGLIDPIIKGIESGKPFLGICLGLQVLFTESEEFGMHKGLDLIKGKVVKFPEGLSSHGVKLKIPHMGWNEIKIRKRAPALDSLPEKPYLYFVHSYYVVPEDKGLIATTTDYGFEFVSSVWRDNIFACQFHPEKSQQIGLKILRGFGDMR